MNQATPSTQGRLLPCGILREVPDPNPEAATSSIRVSGVGLLMLPLLLPLSLLTVIAVATVPCAFLALRIGSKAGSIDAHAFVSIVNNAVVCIVTWSLLSFKFVVPQDAS